MRWIEESCNVKIFKVNNAGRITALETYSDTKSIHLLKGQLQGLEVLWIYSIKHLSELIENPESLKRLFLTGAGITSLPSSIGEFQNLEVLDLEFITSMSELPEEVGSLHKLRHLNISGSGIATLPKSLQGLKNLREICLRGSAILRKLQTSDDVEEFLVLLVQQHPSLISLDWNLMWLHKAVNHALAHNRIRLQTGFGTNNNDFTEMLPAVWPHMLCNATRAARTQNHNLVNLEPQDHVHLLLTLGREQFIRVLLDRNRRE